MKPPAIFALVVRGFGVFLLYQTVHTFAGLLPMFAARTFESGAGAIGGGPGSPFAHNVEISAVPFFTVLILAAGAAWFLFGAPPIQDWAYPADKYAPQPNPQSTDTAIAQTKYDGPPCVSCEQRIPVGAKLCPHCGWTQPI